MPEKSRFEIIIDNIVFGGGYKSIHAAWQFTRSESARLEAEMIDLSSNTQNGIIELINKTRLKQFKTYSTSTLKDKIKKALETMVGYYEQLARQMVISNLLAGKLIVNANSKLVGDELVSLISLTDGDYSTAERMVFDVTSKIKQGASLTISSVNAMLQNASIRANQNSKDESDKKLQQVPVSNGFVPDDIDIVIPKASSQKIPTAEELKNIRRNPIAFAQKSSKNNVGIVSSLHKNYLSMVSKNKEELKANSSDKEQSKPSVKQELKTELLTNGLSAFTDAGGKRWSLVTYCSMSTRSIASRSSNFGEIFADESHDLYYLVPHGGSCPICSKFEGKVYSRSGKNPKYPPLTSVFKKIDPNGADDLSNSYLTIHPNCRHKLVRYFEKT